MILPVMGIRRAVIAIIIGLPIIALLCFLAWQQWRDPVTSLPQPEHNLASDSFPQATDAAPEPGRKLIHVILHRPTLGDIGIAVNLPDPLPNEKLPIVMVLGGLGSGASNIRYITDARHNAIVSYDWPMPVQFYGSADILMQLPELYCRLMAIPAQVATAFYWLKTQTWADSDRISLLGFSLGALATPAIEDIAEHDGTPIGWTIIAYGGAPFGAVFTANPHIRPEWLRNLLAVIVDPLLAPLEASKHLPHLHSQFLILEGHDDSLMPAPARAYLRDLTPEPKTVVTLQGDHMGVGKNKMQLLQQIIDDSRQWLHENNAINDR